MKKLSILLALLPFTLFSQRVITDSVYYKPTINSPGRWISSKTNIGVARTAGQIGVGFVEYNGRTAARGKFHGGSASPVLGAVDSILALSARLVISTQQTAISGTSANAYGVSGTSTASYGVIGSSSSSFGGLFTSSGYIGFRANTTGAGNTNNIADFSRLGTPVASIDYNGKGTFNGGLLILCNKAEQGVFIRNDYVGAYPSLFTANNTRGTALQVLSGSASATLEEDSAGIVIQNYDQYIPLVINLDKSSGATVKNRMFSGRYKGSEKIYADSTGRIFSLGGLRIDSAVYFTKLPSAGSGTTLVLDAQNRVIPLSSSRKMKYDISKFKIKSEKIFELTPYQYKYKGNSIEEFGYMAEDVYDVLPELVNLDKDGKPYSLKDYRIVVLLVEEVKKQKKQISDLEKRLTKLEKK